MDRLGFNKFNDFVTANGGEIVAKENWGLKKLAYPIQNKRNGIEVTVVLTEKLAEKEVEDFVDDKDYIDEETSDEETEAIAEEVEA